MLMVRKMFFVVSSLFYFVVSIASGISEIDSLRNELGKTVDTDRRKELQAEIYLRLSENYESTDRDSSNYFTDKGLELYKTPDYNSWMYLRLLNAKANYYYVEGEFKLSKTLFLDVLSNASVMHDRDYDFEANVSMSVGVVYRKLGLADSTLYYYNMASDYGKMSGDKTTLSAIYYNIGAMYFAGGRYAEALSNGEIAAGYASDIDDMEMYMYSMILVASAYGRQERYAEAADILKGNIEKALQRNYYLLAMSSFSPLLSTYQLWGKKDSARIYLEKYEKYVNKIPQGSPTALEMSSVRASLYNWIGEYKKSLDILLGNPKILAQVNYDTFHKLLARDYEGLGDYKNAFFNLQKAYSYSDSITKSRISTEMSELNAKLNVNAKELEISRLENEKALQKAANVRLGIYMGVIIIILFIIILMLQHKRKIQRKEAELNSAKRYIDGLENERKRLAKDLHDGVCSDLLGIIFLMKRKELSEHDKERTVELLEDIRTGVRDISHELMPPSFQLTDLDEMLYDYFAKMEEHTGVNIRYVSKSEKDWKILPHKVCYEVYRILQEMMSNIIKCKDVKNIKVNMVQSCDTLNISVSHDGKWDDANKVTGIGLRTIDDRLKTIGGNYKVVKGEEVTVQVFINLLENVINR